MATSQADGGTRSGLLWEVERILDELSRERERDSSTLPQILLMENVPEVIGVGNVSHFNKWLDKLESLGYSNYFHILNGKDYGIPQNQERVFTISIRKDIDTGYTFPQKQELKLRLKDMLEDNVDEKYYLTDKQIERMTTTTYVSGQTEKRVQTDVCRTLAARDWKDPKCVRIGNIYGENKGGGFAGNVYEKEDLSPALQTMQGGNRQPMIQKTRNLKEQLCDNLIEQGIVHGGEVINHSYTTSEQRNTLDKYIESNDGIMPTMTTRPDILGICVKNNTKQDCGVVVRGNYMPSGHESRIVDSEGLAPTVKENHGTVTATNENLRIRKLTPKECWRLMGFTDEEFEKAAQHNSNSQLYKQAGNSIVVNVLEKILSNLLGDTNE